MSKKLTACACVALLALVAAFTGSALAAGGIKVCVPTLKEGKPIVTPKLGVCKTGYALSELPEGKEGKEGQPGKEGPEGKNAFTAEEIALLKSLVGHVKYVAEGVAGKPTIQFTGVNVQVVSGAGSTSAAPNGEGNLVIGYDENPGKREQTGSNNLVLGEEQMFTSYGGLLAGLKNEVSQPFSTVAGGTGNAASFPEAAILGGQNNLADGIASTIAGGASNSTFGTNAAIAGGGHNSAGDPESTISGGCGNRIGAVASTPECPSGAESILGGVGNLATGEYSVIAAGERNSTTTRLASILGGELNVASGEGAAILGGLKVTLSTKDGHTP